MDTNSPAASQTSRCVEEEYTIHVPLVRPNKKFQEVLRLAGATGEIFTKKEICHYLKDYISSRQLYDVSDPRIVHCGNDLLGQVFGKKQFTIDEVLDLLAKNCVELPDRCVRRKRRRVTRPNTGQLSSNLPPPSVTIAVCHDQSQCVTPLESGHRDCEITSSTQPKTSLLDDKPSESSKKSKRKKISKDGNAESSPRKRHHTEPSSSTQNSESSRQRGTSLSITYGNDSEEDGLPWYFHVEVSDNGKEDDDKSEVLSVQGKETVTVRDSTDDLWFVNDTVDSDMQFSVEYDVESDSPEPTESDLSSVRSGEGLLVVCRESDVEFFADYSDSESNTDDRELTEADNWVCLECNQSNQPFQRYCDRCWKLRSDWLPNRLDVNKQASEKNVSSIDDRKPVLEENPEIKFKAKDSFLKTSDGLDSGVGTQPSSQETVLSGSAPQKTLDLPVMSHLSKSQESLIESSSEQRYSFSSVQLENASLPTVKTTNSPLDDPCMICLTKSKSASLIHGSSGHQVCCFSCAKRLKRRGKVCPVCRRPIQKVVKNYIL